MATAARHKEISDDFLEHAEEEFAKGDYLQASEKAWGAVAHYVKSIAQERGWKENYSHQHVQENARILINSTGRADLHWMFTTTESLHVNFYEDREDPSVVRSGMDAARQLIAALQQNEAGFPMERPPVTRVGVSRRQKDDG